MSFIDRVRKFLGLGNSTEPLKPPSSVARQPAAIPTRDAGGPPASKSDNYLNAEEAAYYFVPDASGRIPVKIRDGFFVHPPTGKRVPPGNRVLQKLGILSFRVRGTQYQESALRAADTRENQIAYLVREPENEYDPNAVAVYGVDRDGNRRKIGYVNKGNARSLAKRIGAGERINARFMRGARPGVRSETSPAVVLATAEVMELLF